jgi:hypothetical protein
MGDISEEVADTLKHAKKYTKKQIMATEMIVSDHRDVRLSMTAEDRLCMTAVGMGASGGSQRDVVYLGCLRAPLQ